MLTVTPDLTLISDCDAIAGWDGDPVVDADFKIQGSGCLAQQVKTTLSSVYAYTFGSAQDMTGKHIYVWMMVAGVADTKANGGFRIYVETDANNYGTWYVGGGDMLPPASHPGGWGCYVIDPASTPTEGMGTVNPASITKIGVQFKTLSSVVGKANNVFWDACRYGSGLTITSGATDQIGLEDIFDEDNLSANKYGVVTKGSGSSYVVQGLLTLGGTGSENIDFIDKSQIIGFPDNEFVSDSFYGIKVQCGTGITNFILGELADTSGISGCLFKAAGAKAFSLDVSDPDNDKVLIYGSTFINAGAISLPPYSVDKEVLSCNFEACGKVVVNTCVVRECNFISAPGDAVLISNDPHHVTDCNFINCLRGVELDTVGDGSYEFNALKFIGTTYHVNNTSGSTLTVANSNGSNASTYTGTLVNFSAAVQLTMVVKDGSGPVVGAFAYIDDLDESPYIMNTLTNQDGIATVGYDGSPVTNARWRVRKYGYKNFKQLIDIGSVDINLPITLIVDPQQT